MCHLATFNPWNNNFSPDNLNLSFRECGPSVASDWLVFHEQCAKVGSPAGIILDMITMLPVLPAEISIEQQSISFLKNTL